MMFATGKQFHTAVKVCSWVLMLLVMFQHATAKENKSYSTNVYTPAREAVTSRCDIYLAPSNLGGWGVFAGRDFEEGEIVEIAPRYIPMKHEHISKNVLDDYYYGFLFQQDLTDYFFGAVILGKFMFYNHGAGENQNVNYTNFGHEPVKHFPWMAQTIAFVANRDIQRGEELLSTYGETDKYFKDRGLTMVTLPKDLELPSAKILNRLEEHYCSKAVAGIGHSTWLHRVMPAQEHLGHPMRKHDYQRYMPQQDHPTAIAMEYVGAGELIEIAPALVLPVDQVEQTPLGPMLIFWKDWDEEQKESIYNLGDEGAFRMKGLKTLKNETGKSIPDLLHYDEAAVFPAAGIIGMVRKVGRDSESSNCRLEVASSMEELNGDQFDLGSAGVVLKLIATKDIFEGDELRLNLPETSVWKSKMMLLQHLAMTGQPIPDFLADSYNRDVEFGEEL